MQKTINDLVQLQELMEARLQQDTLTPGSRLAPLDAAIRKMLDALPPTVGPVFERVQRKLMVGIVPVVNGVCTGCGIALPGSLDQDVRAMRGVHQCPSCSRFLFAPDPGPRRKPPSPRSRAAAPRRRPVPRTSTGIARFSAPALMMPGFQASTAEEAIRAMCAQLVAEKFAENADRLAESALRREAISSTAIENGLAFPHVRGADGGGLSLALAASPRGIAFNPELRTKTRLVFLVVIPSAASAFYLQLLSGLIKSLDRAEARRKLIEAESPEDLWKALTQATRRHIA